MRIRSDQIKQPYTGSYSGSFTGDGSGITGILSASYAANVTAGTSGTSGINGTSGTSGVNGTSGTSGTTGTSGTSGVSGSSGTSGTSGVSGSSGTTGTSGTGGTSGISGSSGTSGTTGTSGTSGISGSNGTSGTSGNSGTSGTSGISGSSGTSGINGTSGTTGTSGVSGSSGTSGINGTSGTSGVNGTSGITGTSGTSATPGLYWNLSGSSLLTGSPVINLNNGFLTFNTGSVNIAGNLKLGSGSNDIFLNPVNSFTFGNNNALVLWDTNASSGVSPASLWGKGLTVVGVWGNGTQFDIFSRYSENSMDGNSGFTIRFYDAGTIQSSTPDTGIRRNNVGILEINNTIAGVLADLRLRSLISSGSISASAFQYNLNVTSSYTSRSLVDQEYVDRKIASIPVGSGSYLGDSPDRINGTATSNVAADLGVNTLGITAEDTGSDTKTDLNITPGQIDITRSNTAETVNSQLSIAGSGISMNVTDRGTFFIGTDGTPLILLTDNRTGADQKGLEYAGIYASNYTSFSLITKGDLDNAQRVKDVRKRTIDFGSGSNEYNISIDIGDVSAISDNKIFVSLSADATDDHSSDEISISNIILSASTTDGVGYTIYAYCPEGTTGTYTVNFLVIKD